MAASEEGVGDTSVEEGHRHDAIAAKKDGGVAPTAVGDLHDGRVGDPGSKWRTRVIERAGVTADIEDVNMIAMLARGAGEAQLYQFNRAVM